MLVAMATALLALNCTPTSSFDARSRGIFAYNNMVVIDGFSRVRGFDVYANTSSNVMTRIYHNSVNITGTIFDNDGIEQDKGDNVQGFAAPNSVAAYFNGNSAVDAVNNIWHNFGDGQDAGPAVEWQNAQNSAGVVDFNNLMTAGRYVGIVNGSYIIRNTTGNPLSNWIQAAGVDNNSSSVLVEFVGGTDLHLMAIDQALFGAASIKGEVDMDIDGDDRVVPYMGADEIQPNAVIVDQPDSRYVCVGEAFQLICVADVTEGARVTYQWYRDGEELAGRTGPILNFGNTGYNSSAVYTCVIKVTDGFTEKEITSEPASIIVVRPTNITMQPQSGPVAPWQHGDSRSSCRSYRRTN